MINRWNVEIKRGNLISFHSSRGDVRVGWAIGFFRISGYGWRLETTAGSCGIDDVTKSTRDFIRQGCRIEIGTGKPGYRWVQGWEVLNPETGAWSTPAQFKHARDTVRNYRGVK